MPLQNEPKERLAEIQAKAVAKRAADTSVMARPKNTAALRHGALSKKSPGERAGVSKKSRSDAQKRIWGTTRKIFELHPHLDRQRDYLIVKRLATKLRQLEEADIYLEVNGLLDEDGNPRAAESASNRLTALVLKMITSLGLDPASAVAMGVSVKRAEMLVSASALLDATKPKAVEAKGKVVG